MRIQEYAEIKAKIASLTEIISEHNRNKDDLLSKIINFENKHLKETFLDFFIEKDFAWIINQEVKPKFDSSLKVVNYIVKKEFGYPEGSDMLMFISKHGDTLALQVYQECYRSTSIIKKTGLWDTNNNSTLIVTAIQDRWDAFCEKMRTDLAPLFDGGEK